MGIVGYLEGTDPILLTKLASRGIETLPLSNGADGHGKYIGHITKADNIALVIGYLHKLMPIKEMHLRVGDMLFACKTHNIPVLVVVPTENQEEAKIQLGDITDYVILIDPGELSKKAFSLVERWSR